MFSWSYGKSFDLVGPCLWLILVGFSLVYLGEFFSIGKGIYIWFTSHFVFYTQFGFYALFDFTSSLGMDE